MASRTRIISQNKAVYASQTGWYAGGDSLNTVSGIHAHQLHRVDTFSFDIDIAGARQDVREFGQLARIGTVTMSELAPTLNLGYYLGDGENELALGFSKSPSLSHQMISGMMSESATHREKNIYVLTAREGEDAFNSGVYKTNASYHDVIGFGNCFITDYTANFAVGEIPRADVTMEAANVVFYTGHHSGLKNPAINTQGGRADSGWFALDAPSTGDMFGDSDILVLRPNDVIVSFDSNTISKGIAANGEAEGNGGLEVGGTHFGDMHIQSCSVNIPLAREPIETLGSERATVKPLAFPIDVTMSISATTKNMAAGALEHVLTGTAEGNTTNINVGVFTEGGTKAHSFQLKNAVLDSQGFSQGLDDNETVELQFSAQIGGISTTTEGFFWSGIGNYSAPNTNNTVAGGGSLLEGDYFLDQPI